MREQRRLEKQQKRQQRKHEKIERPFAPVAALVAAEQAGLGTATKAERKAARKSCMTYGTILLFTIRN